MTRAFSRGLDVLLVEDNPADIVLTEEAFALGASPSTLRSASDGEEALTVLRGPAGELPDLILMDVNMPRLGGLETLAQLKADPDLRHIPVVMLTTSSDPRDIDQAYALGANAFVTKPVNLPDFLQVVEQLLSFWSSLATLPSRRMR
ncbi:response regulator4 [Deinococcus aerius]|uniref:Response regulator4 n=1 Tax=Deinococcus aerius TaxID=200253 RepID=A0A2I9DMI9_9DEIO|nr:response regulator [Deinococcus aerius]GBF06231.1 response regulator4 [Deinococcus aerius]